MRTRVQLPGTHVKSLGPVTHMHNPVMVRWKAWRLADSWRRKGQLTWPMPQSCTLRDLVKGARRLTPGLVHSDLHLDTAHVLSCVHACTRTHVRTRLYTHYLIKRVTSSNPSCGHHHPKYKILFANLTDMKITHHTEYVKPGWKTKSTNAYKQIM